MKTRGKEVTARANIALPTIKAGGYLRKDIEPISEVGGRSIQYYTDMGLVKPAGQLSGKGTKRRYSKQNIFEILLIQVLVKHGLVLLEMKPIIQSASQAYKDLSESGPKVKKLTLILYTLKTKSDQSGTAYEVQLKTESQFDFSINMEKFASALIIDISEILEKINLI